jgi:hypothetical protein
MTRLLWYLAGVDTLADFQQVQLSTLFPNLTRSRVFIDAFSGIQALTLI